MPRTLVETGVPGGSSQSHGEKGLRSGWELGSSHSEVKLSSSFFNVQTPGEHLKVEGLAQGPTVLMARVETDNGLFTFLTQISCQFGDLSHNSLPPTAWGHV